MTISRTRARSSACVCALTPHLFISFTMEEIATLFDKFGFAVALSITLLIFAYRFVRQYIRYLQDTIKDLSSIIAKNTELYKLLYDYLTKN